MARLQILTAAVCFGTTGTAQALATTTAAPAAVGAARLAVGAFLLAGVAALARGATERLPRRELALAGGFIAVYQATFFAAVADTGVAVGTVVALGSAPAFAGLIGRVWAGEQLTARWALATAFACAGVALLTLGGAEGSVSPAGVGLALIAGAGYAAYTVGCKRMLTAGASPEHVMASAFGLAAVLLAPVLIAAGGPLAAPEGIALALYLGAIPTALAYLIFARGLRHVGSGEAATLTLAEPVTAAILGVAVLGEQLDPIAGLGAAIVVGGLALLGAPARARRRGGRVSIDPAPAGA